MADVFRGPLYVNRREASPCHRVFAFVVPSLLATVLAVAGQIPLPLGAAHALPLQVLPPKSQLVQNADTTRGSPKGLLADAQLPFQALKVTAPDRRRPVTDTTKGQPLTLKAAVAPVVVPPHFAPPPRPDRNRLPPDTSRGAINADAQAPAGESAAWAPIALVRNVVDTTQSQPLTLQAIVPPFVPAPHIGPLRFWWQPPDTSWSAAKAIIADAQLPFQITQQTAPDRIRPVVDTSESAYALQNAVVIPPFVPAPHYGPVKFWWQPQDSSEGTPKGLTQDGQVPFAILAQTAPDRTRPVADTSQSAFAVQNQIVAAPFVPAPHVAPAKFQWQPPDGSVSLSLPLTASNTVMSAPLGTMVLTGFVPAFIQSGSIDWGGWYLLPSNWRRKKRKAGDVAAAEQKVKLAIARAVADTWDKALGEIEAKALAEVDADKVRIEVKRRDNFLAYLKTERLRQEQARKAEEQDKIERILVAQEAIDRQHRSNRARAEMLMWMDN